MKKPKHRKKYPPPGPCGAWFRQQHQSKMNKTNAKNSADCNSTGDGAMSTPHRQQQTPSSLSSFQMGYGSAPSHLSQQMTQDGSSPSQRRSKAENDISYSDAWASMLQSLNIATPYLNPNDSIHKKYSIIRQHVPEDYVLLNEILNGQYDLSVPYRVLVQVKDVEARNIHHNIWTVQLTDETGSVIRAWLEPKYVQQQMQKSYSSRSSSTSSNTPTSNDRSIIRTGVVWMLQNVTMIVDSNKEDDEDKVERILLISDANIEKFWLPEDVDNSEEGQKRYLDFMERRKAKSTADDNCGGNEIDDNGPTPDEVDEELMYRRQQLQQHHHQQGNAIENIAAQQQNEGMELNGFRDDTSTSRMNQTPTLQHQVVAESNNSDGHSHNPGIQQTQTNQISPSQPQLEMGSSIMDAAESTNNSNNDPMQSQQQLQNPSYHQRTDIDESQQSTQSTYRPTTQDTAGVAAAAEAVAFADVLTCTQQQQDQLPSPSPSASPFDDDLADNNEHSNNDENKSSNNNVDSTLSFPSVTHSDKKKKKKKSDRRRNKRAKGSEGIGDEAGKRSRQRTLKKRHETVTRQKSNATKNTPVSAIWTTQDTSLIELFESSDDEENSHIMRNEKYEDTKNVVATGRDNDESTSTEEEEGIFGKSADESTAKTSIFDLTNLGGIDPSVFDEDE